MNRLSLLERLLLFALITAGALSWIHRTSVEPMPDKIDGLEKATLAGGCYWCMEPTFARLPGVVHVRAGHAGQGTRRREAVEILFDPEVISYGEILAVFWVNIDPLDDNGQFCDRGSDYRSGIFVHDETQRAQATRSEARVEEARGYEIATEILDDELFLPAAEHDQNYSLKHPIRYRLYRMNCGRDARLHEVWAK